MAGPGPAGPPPGGSPPTAGLPPVPVASNGAGRIDDGVLPPDGVDLGSAAAEDAVRGFASVPVPPPAPGGPAGGPGVYDQEADPVAPPWETGPHTYRSRAAGSPGPTSPGLAGPDLAGSSDPAGASDPTSGPASASLQGHPGEGGADVAAADPVAAGGSAGLGPARSSAAFPDVDDGPAGGPYQASPYAMPPTAADFAARRAYRAEDPVPTMGFPAFLRKITFGLVTPALSRKEAEHRHDVATVRRNFGGLRQVTVVNPKGGAGKTVAVLMTAMTFGQQRGGYVLSWDNNETQGTLGMRAQQDFHARTVRDLLDDLEAFRRAGGRVGDLSSYVRSQGEAMFDVLASDESATAGEMLTARAFADLREVVSRFYKLIIVDTGNNVRAENWQAAIDQTDQLIVTMSARGDSAETAARMLDHLEQTGRDQLVRQAVSVISMPASRKGLDLPAIQQHFTARTRAVLIAPYEPLLDSGEPIRYHGLSSRSRTAWLRIASAVAEGL